MHCEYPHRIVCLTDETTETLYLLEEDWRIVGISGFCVRPVQAKREKRIVSTFTKAKTEEIVELQPDLVLGFSDVQADIAAELVRAGLDVHLFNQRTIDGIFRMIRTLGGMIGCQDKAEALVRRLQNNLKDGQVVVTSDQRPRVYFEEWHDPLVAGIGWVSELVNLAGGQDVFTDSANHCKAMDRVVEPEQVIKENPDLILASWCGKPVDVTAITNRPGWDQISAVQRKQIFELDSSIILQPGPAALTEGFDALRKLILTSTAQQM